MSDSKAIVAIAALLCGASLVYSFAPQQAPDNASNPFHGKVLYLDARDVTYGAQENVQVVTVGTESFLVLEPIIRQDKDGTAYSEQHWVAVDDLKNIVVFESRKAAELYKKTRYPYFHDDPDEGLPQK